MMTLGAGVHLQQRRNAIDDRLAKSSSLSSDRSFKSLNAYRSERPLLTDDTSPLLTVRVLGQGPVGAFFSNELVDGLRQEAEKYEKILKLSAVRLEVYNCPDCDKSDRKPE